MTPLSLQNKNNNALRTIGEAAEILVVPTHVIRFWETKFVNIKPVKYNNRRYYSPDDLAILKKIKALLYEQNYSIKEAISHFKQKKLVAKIVVANIDLSTLVKVRDRLLHSRNRLNKILYN